MYDICELLGIKKLNTTAYHPQCDGLVERYNRTVKTALRKHAASFGVQWDRAFNGPTLTEIEPTDVMDYCEEFTMSLSSARKLAAEAIHQAQKKYKGDYDKKTLPRDYRIGEWVLVKFPADETGQMRKLSRPWHGLYRVTEQNNPDVTVVKVYRPQDGAIQVHKTRVNPCPAAFPAGYHWYGNRRSSPGRLPRWVDHLR